jgi:dephospho-CoA kinase
MTIGVTGGIGSGKSTVCALFGGWGAHLIDADKVGHACLEDPGVKRALIEAFGDHISRPDGSLNRRELGRRAFVSDASRRSLTDIVWPEVGKRLRAAVDRLWERGSKIIVVEASVLLERGDPENLYETVVVVTAPEVLRIERTVNRLGITEAEVRARMRHQMREDEKIKRADYVIVNDGSVDVLETRARKLWADLTRSASKE